MVAARANINGLLLAHRVFDGCIRYTWKPHEHAGFVFKMLAILDYSYCFVMSFIFLYEGTSLARGLQRWMSDL